MYSHGLPAGAAQSRSPRGFGCSQGNHTNFEGRSWAGFFQEVGQSSANTEKLQTYIRNYLVLHFGELEKRGATGGKNWLNSRICRRLSPRMQFYTGQRQTNVGAGRKKTEFARCLHVSLHATIQANRKWTPITGSFFRSHHPLQEGTIRHDPC